MSTHILACMHTVTSITIIAGGKIFVLFPLKGISHFMCVMRATQNELLVQFLFTCVLYVFL